MIDANWNFTLSVLLETLTEGVPQGEKGTGKIVKLLETVAKRDEGNFSECDLGPGCFINAASTGIVQRALWLVWIEKAEECVEGRTDEYMGDAVIFTTDQRNGGMQQGSHGLAPSGNGSDEVAVFIANYIPNSRKDEFGSSLVFGRGADVVEGDCATAGGIWNRDDMRRLGDEFIRIGFECLAEGFPDREIVPIRARGEEFRLDFGGTRHGGDKGDAPRQNPWFAHGESP